MFSTILDKITGYFDKRALISAFFPGLVFWGITVTLVVMLSMGRDAALKGWDALSVTSQFLFLLAFLVWVAFWSFLTINFRADLMRLYEGYSWPQQGWAGILYTKRLQHWKKHWQELDEQDRELEMQEVVLLGGSELLSTARTSLARSPAQSSAGQPPASVEPLKQDYVAIRQKLEEQLSLLRSAPEFTSDTATRLQAALDESQAWWDEHGDELSAGGSELPERRQLGNVMQQLRTEFNQRLKRVQRRRLSIFNKLLAMPPDEHNLMPTLLGNIMKSAEMYSSKRYSLDAVLIWSRLQPSLPAGFSESLQDAKTSLDLMVTLAASTLFFGIPLSVWIAVRSAWWIGLLTALFAIALSWLSYLNATRAAIQYGDKIRTAFDLYRWKVLENMHLELPKSLDEERHIWQEVCGLLAREYTPDAQYYRYKQPEEDKR